MILPIRFFTLVDPKEGALFISGKIEFMFDQLNRTAENWRERLVEIESYDKNNDQLEMGL
jgi:hypothetical protein